MRRSGLGFAVLGLSALAGIAPVLADESTVQHGWYSPSGRKGMDAPYDLGRVSSLHPAEAARHRLHPARSTGDDGRKRPWPKLSFHPVPVEGGWYTPATRPGVGGRYAIREMPEDEK